MEILKVRWKADGKEDNEGVGWWRRPKMEKFKADVVQMQVHRRFSLLIEIKLWVTPSASPIEQFLTRDDKSLCTRCCVAEAISVR